MIKIILYLVCALISALITIGGTYLALQRNMRKSIISLLQINIYNLYLVCKGKKYRTAMDSIAFLSLLKRYYALGGDDYIHDIEKRFKALEEREI